MNDVPQPAPGQAPQMDPNMAMRVMNLYGRIDEVLKELRVPTSERKQVEQNLMEAIAADLMVRLGSRMTQEQKDRLMELTGGGKTKPNLGEVAIFFRDSFSQQELLNDLAEATESVLTDFMKEMGK